jgi:hypothetical protein
MNDEPLGIPIQQLLKLVRLDPHDRAGGLDGPCDRRRGGRACSRSAQGATSSFLRPMAAIARAGSFIDAITT